MRGTRNPPSIEPNSKRSVGLDPLVNVGEVVS